MITVNNKQYRNLEEQVQKNKTDIENLIASGGVLDEFGIKVVGELNNIDELPTPEEYKTSTDEWEYGDAFAIGTQSPYQLFILTRAGGDYAEDHWLNIGAFPAPGPTGATGATGPQGEQGRRGSQWYSGSTAPYPDTSYYLNDKYLDVATGNVYSYYARNDDPNLAGHWSLIGNIRGPQGITGVKGDTGSTGPAGPQGPQGVKGDAGQSFQIKGILASTDLLPTPSETIRTHAYAIGNDTDGYDLYVIAENNGALVWVNMGRVAGVEGPQGPMGPQGEPGLGATVVVASGGSISMSEVEEIVDNRNVIILESNEMYYLADLPSDNATWVFTHVGEAQGEVYTKTLSLNRLNGSYSINVLNVASQTELETYKTEFESYKTQTDAALDTKQETLVSGTNIKTINDINLLGSGNINISGAEFVDTLPETSEINKLYVYNNKFYQWIQDPNNPVGYGSITDLQNWALNKLVQYKFTPPTSGAQELYNAFAALGLGEGHTEILASGTEIHVKNEEWTNGNPQSCILIGYEPGSWYSDNKERYYIALQDIRPNFGSYNKLLTVIYDADSNNYYFEEQNTNLYEPKMLITAFTNDSTFLPFLTPYWTIYNGTWAEVSPVEIPTSLEYLTKLSMIDDSDATATIFRNQTESGNLNHYFRFGSSGADAIWANEYGGKFILFGPDANGNMTSLTRDYEITSSIYTNHSEYHSVIQDGNDLEQYLIFAAAPWGIQHRNLLYKYPTQSGTLMVKEDILVVVNDDNTIDLIIN